MVMLITIKTNAVVGDVQNDDLDNKSSNCDDVIYVMLFAKYIQNAIAILGV